MHNITLTYALNQLTTYASIRKLKKHKKDDYNATASHIQSNHNLLFYQLQSWDFELQGRGDVLNIESLVRIQ
jgi:hypothetical protein